MGKFLIALALLMLLTFWMLRTTPKGFIPDEGMAVL